VEAVVFDALLGNAVRDAGRSVGFQPTLRVQRLAERRSLHEFHNDEAVGFIHPNIEDHHDVGVL
jgi:hypothetical protein